MALNGGAHLVRADLARYKAASNLNMNEHIKKEIAAGKLIHHLAFGQSPFPVPRELKAALVKHAGQNAYLSITGTEDIRQAICGFHNAFPTGIPETHLQPENIIVSDGSKMLIYLVMAVSQGIMFLKSPSWTTYKPQTVLARMGKQINIPSSHETGWKMTAENVNKVMDSLDAEDRAKNKFMVFTNPCNPAGVLYTEEELEGISAVLRKYGVIVISDEIYSHLAFSGNSISLSKYYPEGTVITTGLSKWASAGGWRVGYAIFPAELSSLRLAVSSASSHTFSCCAAPQQYAAAEFLLKTAACGSFMKHSRRILAAVSKMCVRNLRSVGVQVCPAEAGYYIFPDFEMLRDRMHSRGILTGQQFCDTVLDEAAVSLLPGGPAHLRPDNEFTVRLCFINFDGSAALTASEVIGLDTELPSGFVEQHCSTTVAAIKALTDWCTKQLHAAVE